MADELSLNDQSVGRLTYIDFFRGLALVIVLLDHIDLRIYTSNPFTSITPIGWGYSDASELFLFISGFTFGYVYTHRIEKNGFFKSLANVLTRSKKIYLSYVMTIILIVLLGLSTDSKILSECLGNVDSSEVKKLAWQTLSLQYQPYCMHILALYTVIFIPMLLLLRIMLHKINIALIISALTYLYVHINPNLNLPATQGISGWFFNPFAWQFLFTLAMLFGNLHAVKWQFSMKVKYITLVISIFIITFGILDKVVFSDISILDRLLQLLPGYSHWTRKILLQKSGCGLIRILHCIALVVIANYSVAFVDKYSDLNKKSLALATVQIGQHPLFLYCSGVVLTYISLLILEFIGSTYLNTLAIGIGSLIILYIISTLRVRIAMLKF